MLTYQERWKGYFRCVSQGSKSGCGMFIPFGYGFIKETKIYTAEEIGIIDQPAVPVIEEHIIMGDINPEDAKIIVEADAMTQESLLKRVAAGNDRLMKHFASIMQEKDNDIRESLMDNFHDAIKRLNLLCGVLEAKGYRDCLYVENGKRMRSCLNQRQDCIACWACPSERKYWSEELFGTKETPKFIPSHRGKQVMEFLKKMGNGRPGLD